MQQYSQAPTVVNHLDVVVRLCALISKIHRVEAN